ncbi:MAG: hypothetical protein R3344_15055, partial [Acidobacteriota bacterium]|nr:hypothetical protein [Acidobacteriota bacterium]
MYYVIKYIVVLGVLWAAPPAEDLGTALETGYAHLENGDVEGAARSFRTVLANRPDHPEALRGLVVAGLRPQADDALALEARDAARWLMTLDPANLAALDQWSQLDARLTSDGERRFREPWNPLGPPATPVIAADRPARVRIGDGGWIDLIVQRIEPDPAGSLDGQAYSERLAKTAAGGANTVQLAGLMPPAFYRALATHNRDAEVPLFLIQGLSSRLSPEGDAC